MKGFRWLRVMLDTCLYSALWQAKAQRGVTWDTVAEEALQLWLSAQKTAA